MRLVNHKKKEWTQDFWQVKYLHDTTNTNRFIYECDGKHFSVEITECIIYLLGKRLVYFIENDIFNF